MASSTVYTCDVCGEPISDHDSRSIRRSTTTGSGGIQVNIRNGDSLNIKVDRGPSNTNLDVHLYCLAMKIIESDSRPREDVEGVVDESART